MTYSDTSSSRSSDSEQEPVSKKAKGTRKSDEDKGNRPSQADTPTKSRPESNIDSSKKPQSSANSMDITNRTGGAYIPPAKLRMMQKEITDKSSEAYQRLSWDLLKKSIHGLVNKVNAANITQVVQQLFSENLIRGRGLFAKSVLEAQAFSPTFTPVYAALIAIVNSKFPQIGELILRRLVLNFRKAYRRNAKQQCITSLKLIAHLVNQSVAHEVLSLEILLLLLKDPVTDAGVELAIVLVKEVGQKLTEVSPRGMNSIFERLRQILHEGGAVTERVQYMIELAHAVRKDGFKSYPSVPTVNKEPSSDAATGSGGGPFSSSNKKNNNSGRESAMDQPEVSHSLDLVCEGDQMTHLLRLDEVEASQTQDTLNVFKSDPSYLQNEAKYEKIKRAILGEDEDDEEGGGEDESGSEGEDSEEGGESANEGGGETGLESSASTQRIVDKTDTDLMSLRRTVYLTIQSSLSFEECAHKLLKLDIKDDQMMELCQMVVDCCAQQRSYERFYGLLASKFCLLRKEYMQSYELIFRQQYETIHRLDSNKLRNTAKLFAHMLYCDALPWTVIECIHLNENETTSSGRIFIKYLFQELSQHMGLPRLHARLNDPTLAVYFEGIFPRDNPKHTRFAINMFTSIGLGGLTDELRAHIASVSSMTNLNGAPKVALPKTEGGDSSDDSSSDSSSSSGSSSDSSDSTSSAQNGEGASKDHREVISNSLHTSPNKIRSLEKLESESLSLGGTPSRRQRKGSTNRDNILRRAAIEHHRRQNRKMSSSSEDEKNEATERRVMSRHDSPYNSSSSLSHRRKPKGDSRSHRKASSDEKERDKDKEKKRSKDDERAKRRSPTAEVKREPLSDDGQSSPDRRRRKSPPERRRNDSRERYRHRDGDKDRSTKKSHRNRSPSSSSRDRRKGRHKDTDKENKASEMVYSKEVKKKLGSGFNVADTLGHEIVSQYEKRKEVKLKEVKRSGHRSGSRHSRHHSRERRRQQGSDSD